jgi:hypothetical protein
MMTTHGFMGYDRWQDNPRVTAVPGGHRSNTTGDVLIHAGQSLEIAADNGLHLKPTASIDKAPAAAERRSAAASQPASPNDRVERELAHTKTQPEIPLDSTRHYVMPDPEDAASVYDTCDVLGPWETLTPTEKLSALHELNWEGVSDHDKRHIIKREVDLSQVSDSDWKRYFADLPRAQAVIPDSSDRAQFQERDPAKGVYR